MLIEFCLPVCNEEKILRGNVLKLLNYCRGQNFNFTWRIVIVINGSTDGCLAVSRQLAQEHREQITYVNIKPAGKGQAIKKYGLISLADFFVYMDIDLAVSLNNIPQLISPLLENNADLVIGSRLLPGSFRERSWLRELSSQSYNFISRRLLGHNFSDLQCGFKAIKTADFKKIIPKIRDDKWFFDTELIMFARQSGLRILEIPVNWSENRYQSRKSKVNIIADSLKFFCNLIQLKKRMRS